MKIEDLELTFINLLKALAPEERMQIIKNRWRFDLGLSAMDMLIVERKDVPQSLDLGFAKRNGIIEEIVCPYINQQSRWPCEGWFNRLVKLFDGDIAFLCLNGNHSSQTARHIIFDDERLTNYRLICGCCCDGYLPKNFDVLLNEAARRLKVKKVIVHSTNFYELHKMKLEVEFIADLQTEEWLKPENAKLLKMMQEANRRNTKLFTFYGFGERLR